MAKFNKLDVPYQWRDEFTKYPHGYTIFEALCKWTKQVDGMVDNVNDWNVYLDEFVTNFDEELQREVQTTIEKWQNDGLLDGIIESALSTELAGVKTQLSEKASKDALLVERARIDSLATLSEGSTTGDAELIDARVGADGIIYDNVGGAIRGQFDKIKNDLAEHKELIYQNNIKNIIKNGNFKNIDSWVGNSASLSVVNNVIRVVGTGEIHQNWLIQNTNTPVRLSNKYYVRADVRVLDSECNHILCQFDGSTSGTNKEIKFIRHPIMNTWYTVEAVDTLPEDATGDFKLLFGALYTDKTIAKDKIMEVKNVVVVDLTEGWGIGKEPSIEYLPSEWFEMLNPTIVDVNRRVSILEDEIDRVITGEGKSLEVTFLGDKHLASGYLGDASLIKFPNGKTMGIDFGLEVYGSKLKEMYNSKGVTKLDYIIISHWHDDHAGGLQYLLDNNLIDIANSTVFLPNPTSVQYAIDNGLLLDTSAGGGRYIEPLMQYFTDNNCNIVYPSQEFEKHSVGDCDIVFFNVDHSVYHGNSTNYNDWSLCNYIFYGNTNICFTGDIGPTAQAHLAGKLYKANIYKADHHGWLNHPQMSPEYLNNICPDVIVSMDGPIHDTYIMQQNSPLQTWAERNNVSNYRTRINGQITVLMNTQSWRLKDPASRYIRNDKNWKFTDNTEFIE